MWHGKAITHHVAMLFCFLSPCGSSFFRCPETPNCQLKVYSFFLHIPTHLPRTLLASRHPGPTKS